LKLPHEVEKEEIDVGKLPRYILAANSDFYARLFALLKSSDDKLKEEAWKLLQRLPTSRVLFARMI